MGVPSNERIAEGASAVVSSPPRSLLYRTSWYTALALAAILIHPGTAGASYELQDDTPPLVTYSIDGIDGSNGWYRGSTSGAFIVVHWTVSDPDSPVLSTTGCEPAIRIDDPNTGTTRTCSATSSGGTTAVTTKQLKVDATPPETSVAATTAPNGAGWYRSPVTLQWSGTDATSGLASCTPQLTYSSPDTTGTSKSGSCTDNAGNTSAAALTVRYDSTPPLVTVTPARPADHDGWYNHPVSISWSGTDATSGIDSCTAPLTYSGPDNGNASSGGHCTDHAGNTASPPALSFRYDETPPSAAALPSRPPDAGGWYNHRLTVDWSGSDPTSGIASCSSYGYGGPDSASVQPSGVCTDKAGNTSAPAGLSFRFDATPPAGIAAAPARAPDHNGWYNHPLPVRWTGSDALSGIASCTSMNYGSPTTGATALSGSCTDQAGNTSAPSAFDLDYDQVPPVLARLGLTALDGRVHLRWRVSGAIHVTVTRSPGLAGAPASVLYDGSAAAFIDRKADNYVRYSYVVTAEDAAGNALRRTAFATPKPILFAPRPGARVSAGGSPAFAWKPMRKTLYYNLQLWLGGRQVGSWWPSRARLALPSHWRFGHGAHRLEPGDYAWYVWPGRGAKRLGRYGRLLGKSTFSVR